VKLHRVVVEWNGPQVVGRSVNVLHFDGTEQAAPPVAAVRSAYAALANRFPSGITITVPGAGDSIESTTGALSGVWSATPPAQVVATGGGNAAAGVGVCVGWLTGGIVTGIRGPRKLRGRTFLVPLAAANYATDGTIDSVVLGEIQTWGNAMIAAGGLGIWHRPTTAGGSDGNSYGVLTAKVRDKVAYLSSRRD
jgi:hypothetical protein